MTTDFEPPINTKGSEAPQINTKGSEAPQINTKGSEAPQIVGFLCRWCSYPGADLAGTSRLTYPPFLRIIRVPCSGRVDPLFVLKAFQDGADGVMVLGCHPGDCHYVEGNYHARRRYALMHRLLEYVGVERDRLLVDWVSAAEGRRFAAVTADFTAQIKELGPWGGKRVDS